MTRQASSFSQAVVLTLPSVVGTRPQAGERPVLRVHREAGNSIDRFAPPEESLGELARVLSQRLSEAATAPTPRVSRRLMEIGKLVFTRLADVSD
jgi:hypothetical protein